MNRELLINELMRDEGARFLAYKDTNGFYTIGVGHLLGPSMRMSDITQREMMALLNIDIADAISACQNVFPRFHLLDDVRQRALVNMAFNRGETNMRESTTITPAINKAAVDGNWAPVGTAILASEWGRQIKKRAERLAAMLVTGRV